MIALEADSDVVFNLLSIHPPPLDSRILTFLWTLYKGLTN